MKKKLIGFLKIAVPLFIGIYLTWYFISGLSEEDLDQTKNAFFEANYFWVFVSLLVAFLSHLSRAYRWRFLLEPIGFRPKLSNAYHAVMSGYIINYTVPRSGEVARAGLMASAENVPFEKGFATIIVERVIDVLMFGVVFAITGVLQVNSEKFKAITQREESSNPYLIWILVVVMLVLSVAFLIVLRKKPRFRTFFVEKLKGFLEGLKTIWTMRQKWAFLFHTLFIWTCYVGMIWIGAQIFPQTEAMPLACVFGAFVVGAAAIAILPGGIGAYPVWVNAVLLIYGIQFAAFGIFVWVIQTALIVVLGLISLFLIQQKIKV